MRLRTHEHSVKTLLAWISGRPHSCAPVDPCKTGHAHNSKQVRSGAVDGNRTGLEGTMTALSHSKGALATTLVFTLFVPVSQRRWSDTNANIPSVGQRDLSKSSKPAHAPCMNPGIRLRMLTPPETR